MFENKFLNLSKDVNILTIFTKSCPIPNLLIKNFQNLSKNVNTQTIFMTNYPNFNSFTYKNIKNVTINSLIFNIFCMIVKYVKKKNVQNLSKNINNFHSKFFNFESFLHVKFSNVKTSKISMTILQMK